MYVLSEDDFVLSFEACSFPNDSFKHADHLRLAWIYVRRYGCAMAEERICESIRRFAASLGHEEKYHETMTRVWLRLVFVAYRATPALTSFDEFKDMHPWLFDRHTLFAFYSEACL